MTQKIINRIHKIKKEREITILAHNYTLQEVQDIADFCGDTLEISKKVKSISNETVLICGVTFMAETVKILAPQKRVLIPTLDAICPMADMINIRELNKIQKLNPDAITVCYVNSNLKTKANSDICCTSSNAKMIINNIPSNKKIIFIPDKNLGENMTQNTEKNNIITLNGYCPVHCNITKNILQENINKYPDALVIAHPECTQDVVKLADEVISTGKMFQAVKNTIKNTIIIATEPGIIYRLKKENPEKQIIPVLENNICENMKKITLQNILDSIITLKYEIKIKKKTLLLAKNAIEKMLTTS